MSSWRRIKEESWRVGFRLMRLGFGTGGEEASRNLNNTINKPIAGILTQLPNSEVEAAYRKYGSRH